MDVSALRAEIKAWEREFKGKQGREPSVQDIKDRPAIAAKYKLYKTRSKTLAKAATSGSFFKSSAHSSNHSSPPPSEPRQPPSAHIVPKSRAVKIDPPVSTPNPFSPSKNRKNVLDTALHSQPASNQSRPNPFATPSKSKNKPRSLSPDPFPLIQPLLLVQHTQLSPPADSAVTRARKRLRGEPVSPSPVKEKRPRVTSQAALSFTGRVAPNFSPDLPDGDNFAADPNDTIIADTPMKPRTGGRNFKVLFNDAALSSREKRAAKPLPPRKKTNSPAPALLGTKRLGSRAPTPSSDEDDDWSNKPRLKSLEASAAKSAKSTRTRTANGKVGIPQALVPTKDDLWSDAGPAKASQSKPSPFSLQRQSGLQPSARASTKRALPDEPDQPTDVQTTTANGFQNLPFIPPSPPPPDSSKPSGQKNASKGKGKGAPFPRKKAKLLENAGEDDEQDQEDDEIQVKEVDPSAHLLHAKHDSDAESDWDTRWRTRPDPNEPASVSARPGRFEVNLPEELQRVLAISPGARTKEVDDEKVVRELLYGSRELHYDPSKGGEIWDVGEESEHGRDTEDWEGEPVPWEVGEL